MTRQSTLRILHVVYEQGRPEGLEVATASALYARRNEGFSVEAWAPKEVRPIPDVANRAREAGVFHRGPGSALALRSHVLKEKISVVHCHDVHSALTMGFLEFTGSMPPVVLSIYRPLAAPAPGRPAHEAIRRLGLWGLRRSADAIVAPSTFARGVILSQGAFEEARTHKITYGASAGSLRAGEAEGGDTGVLLLPVENPPPQRRAAYYFFLQAAQILLKQVLRARVAVVCRREDRSYVDSMAARFSIRANVEVLDWSEFPGCLKRCSIAVLPTGDFQGIRPLVLALGAGAAVIGPDLRGVREFIEPETTGLLVRPSDSQALAGAVRRVASSASARRAFSRAAEASWAADFTPRRMAGQLFGLYRDLAE